MKHCLSLFVVFALAAECCASEFILENDSLSRTISTEYGRLRTTQISNKRAHATTAPDTSPEFRLRVTLDTNNPAAAVMLNSSDFHVLNAVLLTNAGAKNLKIALTNVEHSLGVQLIYELGNSDFFMRKRLTIASAKPIILERIDVEVLGLKDAYQPYTLREITSRAPGKWNPGLGQPLYTSQSGMFWGIEFPAADNQVKDGLLSAGYFWGRIIYPSKSYQTYAAVMGVTDDPKFIEDTFFEYIDRIRARPLRLRIQYNSWFDYGSGVDEKKFAASVAKVNQELVVARDNPPLDAYTIDDGWENAKTNWSDEVWKVNDKFDSDFASSFQAVGKAQSKLGLWLSPGCLFNARSEVPLLREKGFEALSNSMSMAGPQYMQALEKRLLELTRNGVNFFKLDGIFGHLNIRDFDLNCKKYGVAAMPELPEFSPNDPHLNDSKYDEAKIYYLTASTERLMQIFQKMGGVNPNVHILISNGAYLSPWWLMYVDDVWMINAGDAANGTTRSQQLIYRDGRYYDIWRKQNIQFPMCSVFNHEPKKTSTGESPDEFRQYLYMSLSRGTGFIELYLKPFVLQPNDWDILSEGLQWVRKMFPTFARVRMHGGDPTVGQVYGYTAWNQTQGYISIHNPSDKPQTYHVTLNRAFGLLPENQEFYIDSPLTSSLQGSPEKCKFGDSLTFSLSPGEIRIMDFNVTPRK